MKTKTQIVVLIAGLLLVSGPVLAEETHGQVDWNSTLKNEYNLTDDQIKSMTDKGLAGNDMVRLARISTKSGKPLDDVMKMRLEGKMGWGKIAKELGVHPSEIGHAVADAHHEMKEERKAEKAERKLARDAAKAEKKASKRK